MPWPWMVRTFPRLSSPTLFPDLVCTVCDTAGARPAPAPKLCGATAPPCTAAVPAVPPRAPMDVFVAPRPVVVVVPCTPVAPVVPRAPVTEPVVPRPVVVVVLVLAPCVPAAVVVPGCTPVVPEVFVRGAGAAARGAAAAGFGAAAGLAGAGALALGFLVVCASVRDGNTSRTAPSTNRPEMELQ